MNAYEKVAFLINIALLAIIVSQLMQYWIIAIPMLLILTIILIHKINTDRKFQEWDENELRWDAGLKENSGRIDELNENVIEWKVENQKRLIEVESRMAAQKKQADEGSERNFRMLVGRVAEVENRLNQTKRTLAAYMAYLENRMRAKER